MNGLLRRGVCPGLSAPLQTGDGLLVRFRPAGAVPLRAFDGRYVDPLAEVTGRDQFDAVIAAAQAQFAGMTFRLAGPVDAHHDQARFTWHLGPDGADAVVIGFDVAQRDADGRLALVLGFLDKVPSP